MKANVWGTKWDKVELIARGGQGRTYAARPVGTDGVATHVLKELSRQGDEERRARMHQEVENLKRLDHPRVAKVVDSNADRYTDDEELYLVMEFVPGVHLADFVAAGLPEVPTAAAITDSLLETLGYCHSRGVVHRDIKPENIVVGTSDTNNVVLLDFGLSFNQDTQPTGFQTDPGQHLGNRFIILPEYNVRHSNKRDPLSDITQCVGILFYLTTGFSPDNIIDEQNRAPHQRQLARGKLGLYPGDVAKQLNRIFSIGFSLEFPRRWQSIEALRSEIRKLTLPPTETRLDLPALLAEAKARILETPENVIADQLQELKRICQEEHHKVLEKIKQSLAGVLHGVGSIGSLRGTGATIVWVQGFAISTRFSPNALVRVAFFLVRNNDELRLHGYSDKVSGPKTARIESPSGNELGRFGIFDPDARSILQEAMNQFIARQAVPLLTS